MTDRFAFIDGWPRSAASTLETAARPLAEDGITEELGIEERDG
jgi:hypothetical protein